MTTTTYNLHEQTGCWWCPETRQKYKSGGHAFRAIQKKEKRLAAAHGTRANVVIWHVMTRIGFAVAQGHGAQNGNIELATTREVAAN